MLQQPTGVRKVMGFDVDLLTSKILTVLLRLYANENPLHFIPENNTIAYDVIDVNVLLFTLVRFHFKNPE